MRAPAIRHDPGNGLRWALLRWSDIPDPERAGLVYLRRLRVLQTPWFAVYMHWLYLPDGDRDPHDHPWQFWSLILRGSYIEQVYRRPHTKGTMYGRGTWSLHKMPTTEAHRIDLLSRTPTVTLVVTGRRRRTWGFWTDDGFVSWRDYDGGRGPDPFDS